MKQKTKLFLLFWIILMIFPAAWAVRINPRLDLWFNTIFAPEWVHILAHVFLFLVVGYLIPWIAFEKKPLNFAFFATISIGLLIGITQELFQLLIKQTSFGTKEIFDLFIDLFAVSLGFLVFWNLKKIRTKK